MTEHDAWIAFSCCPQIGPMRFRLLVKYFGSARRAWAVKKSEYLEIGFKEELAEKLEDFKKIFDLDSYLLRMTKAKIGTISVDDKEYPERLKTLDDAPYILYVRIDEKLGMTLSELADVSIAVVGSRKMTSYGKEVCERIVSGLVAGGVTIISGLALGIDGIAHRICVDQGGKTIGVLGGGLDQIYPPANRQLGERIVKEGLGALISEFPLEYPAMPQNFPTRNRIVSGMSLGVIIIEGAAKSGTLLTASNAAAQGREVFAVPGPITSPTSVAPHFLIRNGAKLVESAEDVLEELDIKSKTQMSKSKKVLPETPEEEKIINIIAGEGIDIDTIVRISGLDTGIVLSTITTMELKGMVKNMGGNYIKNSKL